MMINLQTQIRDEIKIAFEELFKYDCPIDNISIDETPKNFNGFYTLEALNISLVISMR